MGQFVRANSRPGRRGLFEGGEMTNEDWAAAEAYGASLPDPSWSPGGGAGSTTEWGPNMGGGPYPQPARRTVFPNAGNGNNQTINPFGGIGRVIGRGIRAVGNKLQGLRGWNPDGTPKTQAQWEEEREQRIAQKRINNILGRDAPATKATNINLNRLYNTLGTPKTGRNLFTEGEINRGISPAMRQIYQTPKYELMDGQGTTEFNRLFTNEDEIRQMIENSNKTTSLPGNNDFNTNWANTRRAMTQVGLDTFRNNPVTGEPNFNRGVYDPYGIKTPSGAFSYDMNYRPDRTKPSYRTTSLPGNADGLEFEGGVPRGLNTDDISYNMDKIIANNEFNERPGIHFKDKPIENIFKRQNDPTKGFIDRNFRYRDLNKPDIQAMEPSEGGINYDKRGFSLSGILQGLKNQFKKNPEKQKEFDSWEENKDQTGWGYIGDTGLRGNIYEGPGGKKFSLVDPTTGYNVLQNKSWRGGTGRSLQEQINAKNAWIADRLFKGKGLSGKARAYAKLNKLGTYGDQENPFAPPSSGPGTKAVYEEHGWTQPTYHDDAFTSPRDSESAFGGDFSGAGPSRHARGGRVRYSTGGRVGILSVF